MCAFSPHIFSKKACFNYSGYNDGDSEHSNHNWWGGYVRASAATSTNCRKHEAFLEDMDILHDNHHHPFAYLQDIPCRVYVTLHIRSISGKSYSGREEIQIQEDPQTETTTSHYFVLHLAVFLSDTRRDRADRHGLQKAWVVVAIIIIMP